MRQPSDKPTANSIEKQQWTINIIKTEKGQEIWCPQLCNDWMEVINKSLEKWDMLHIIETPNPTEERKRARNMAKLYYYSTL